MGKFHTKRYYKKQAEHYQEQAAYYKLSYSMLLHNVNSVYGATLRENENEKLRSHILDLMKSLDERTIERDTKIARICILEQQLEDEKAKNEQVKAKADAYDKWFKDNDVELVFSDDYSEAKVKYYNR